MLFLLSRFLLVRPHMFSYLLIPVFLLIYEYAPRRAWWLPLLAVLWVNLHGAEYPVMLLIGGAYLFEWFVNRLRGHQKTAKADLAVLIPAALSMWAALATPHGSKLLTVPFATANSSQYIVEYMPLMSQGFVTLHSVPLPSQRTLFTILLAAAWIGAVMSGYRKKLRVSHLLLLAGGTVLLVKGFRFMYECSLLALPILATNSLIRTSSSNSSIPKLPALPFCAVLVAAPLWWLHAYLGNPPRFPVSPRGLPQGVATFLNRIPAHGLVLNHPNTGGYLQWTLDPAYKIFMDMQCPLLFTEEDLYTTTNMYRDEEVLRKAFAAYDPSFITVPIKNEQFENIIQI